MEIKQNFGEGVRRMQERQGRISDHLTLCQFFFFLIRWQPKRKPNLEYVPGLHRKISSNTELCTDSLKGICSLNFATCGLPEAIGPCLSVIAPDNVQFIFAVKQSPLAWSQPNGKATPGRREVSTQCVASAPRGHY